MVLNLFFGKVSDKLQLGDILSVVIPLSGGLMHKMYRLNTSSGIYVLKLLNPNIMKRPDALHNFAQAEKLEAVIEKENIPVAAAIIFNGEKLQEQDGQYFYVCKYFEGKSLKDKEITMAHCQKIGSILSQIHNIKIKNENYQRTLININWDYYILLAKEQDFFIYKLLNANKSLLYESQNKGNKAVFDIPNLTAICHNDMDCKNVLWLNDDFKIIDLECLSCANPYLEMYELALCWCGYEECNIDYEKFSTFVKAYFAQKAIPKIDVEALYYSNYNRLEWLEYNVKRALFLECEAIDEQELGKQQVKETIKHIIYYDNAKDKIIECLKEIFD